MPDYLRVLSDAIEGFDLLSRQLFGSWIWSAYQNGATSYDGQRSVSRQTEFMSLAASNSILTSRRQAYRQPRPYGMCPRKRPNAWCYLVAAPTAVKRKSWPKFFFVCASNFHRCGYSSRHGMSNGYKRSVHSFALCH